jgi:hypothetical protein
MLTKDEAKQILTEKEYVGWLEMQLVEYMLGYDKQEKEIEFLIKKNMQLEGQEFATTLALLRNPLRIKEVSA